MPPMPHPIRLRSALALIVMVLPAACAHEERPPAAPATTSVAASAASAASASAADSFTCTQVMGVSVTGDWFNAGFEAGVDNARWQVIWRKKAFIELWADPNNEIWSVPIQSACARNANNPDRIIFTGVNWEQTAEPWWEEQFEKVIANLRVKYPNVRRIDLLTMLRSPGNQSCGNVMSVVQPFVDVAIAGVVSKHPGVVFAAPKVHAASCEVFTKGGPHFTDAGMATVGQLYARHLPLDAAGCACKAKK
jgi:hypothetical protein